MKNQLLIFFTVMFLQNIMAQKIIYAPDYNIKNFSVELTKIEITESETILHFHATAMGLGFTIPSFTYIKDAHGNGEKLYITKSIGIGISQRCRVTEKHGIKYKLYFPPLGKDAKVIDYGESNKNGNWFISGINISENKNHDFKTFKTNAFGGYKVVGYPKGYNASIISETENEIVAPSQMPESFYGNWYDKYGTIILVTTPEYVVLNFKIYNYREIQNIGKNEFMLKTTGGNIHVLALEDEKMTISKERIINLSKKSTNDSVPEAIKGQWLHYMGVKKLKITDTYFYHDDRGIPGENEIINNRIDHVAISKSGEVIWFILHNGEKYSGFLANRSNDEYVLSPLGFFGAKYNKVKN